MKTPIPPYRINQILGDRYKDLHRNILGVDVSERRITPIFRDVYYVNTKDPIGRILVKKNTPAMCMYESGKIFCLHDERIELSEPRLVHEFLHRAARHKFLLHYTSGIDKYPKLTFKNEVITEYLTMRIMGARYYEMVNPQNIYLPQIDRAKHIEEKMGTGRFVRAYLNGNVFAFRALKPCAHPSF